MAAGTLTRADIAARINQQVGLSRNESATIVESILSHMCNALAEGENVKISGFGTFVLRDKELRIGRNPRSEEHTSERQSLMLTSYAVFCSKKKKKNKRKKHTKK